jgi:hypothetical protein
MLVALVANHRKNGFFIFRPGEGYEYVLMICLVACAIAALGAGPCLARPLGRPRSSGWVPPSRMIRAAHRGRRGRRWCRRAPRHLLAPPHWQLDHLPGRAVVGARPVRRGVSPCSFVPELAVVLGVRRSHPARMAVGGRVRQPLCGLVAVLLRCTAMPAHVWHKQAFRDGKPTRTCRARGPAAARQCPVLLRPRWTLSAARPAHAEGADRTSSG